MSRFGLTLDFQFGFSGYMHPNSPSQDIYPEREIDRNRCFWHVLYTHTRADLHLHQEMEPLATLEQHVYCRLRGHGMSIMAKKWRWRNSDDGVLPWLRSTRERESLGGAVLENSLDLGFGFLDG